MYDNHYARPRTARRSVLLVAVASALVLTLGTGPHSARAQDFGSPSVIRKISELSEKLELTTNTSRILTLDKPIPRVQVNNPELLAVTPLSATQVQVSAKKAGVTQVNLWDEEGNIHTVDVLIYGDARELQVALQTQFPHSSIKVYRYSESLVLNGFVDRPDHVGPIMRLAEDYAPKVINNISVGGVQQILLKVKVMEISRTKARQLGVDWAFAGSGGDFAFSSVNEIIERDAPNFFFDNNQETFSFGIVGGDAFFATLDALQQARVAKILAEPNLVAVSGRPAQFNVGGEIPILVPQSLGTTAIEYKPFGTQIDFLPIVLGNGNIRLEVRPRVSEIDPSRSVIIDTFEIPGLTVRQVDTAVEMKAGQTFALAGLVQERVNTLNRGLPYLSDVPILGVPFRRTVDEMNEIELLILVTPEFVDAMEPHQVPCGGPGYATVSPTTRQLYCSGHVEVPAHCNPISGMTACGEQAHGYGCSNCPPGGNCSACGPGGPQGGHPHMITDGVVMPGGVGHDAAHGPTMYTPGSAGDQHQLGPDGGLPAPAGEPLPNAPELELPAGTEPSATPIGPGVNYTPGGTSYSTAGSPQYTPPRPHSPARQPVFVRNATKQHNPQQPHARPASVPGEGGLIGPVGYDPQ
jgi:pilus assembly protein CpaC